MNKKQYVGSKVCYHNDPYNDNYFGSSLFLSADIKKYGKEKFHKKIIKLYKSKDQMRLDEILYIKEYNTMAPNGYNRHLPPTKFNTIGISIYDIWSLKYGKEKADKLYIEWKKKEREAQSGEKNPFYGKKHTSKTKQQIREKQTGKKQSEEAKKKKRKTIQERGSLSGANNGMFGKIWITNKNIKKNKIIIKSDLKKYLENEWQKGRKMYKL